MGLNNRRFNITKLTVISAILVVIGDLIDLFVIYQEYYDNQNNKAGNK